MVVRGGKHSFYLLFHLYRKSLMHSSSHLLSSSCPEFPFGSFLYSFNLFGKVLLMHSHLGLRAPPLMVGCGRPCPDACVPSTAFLHPETNSYTTVSWVSQLPLPCSAVMGGGGVSRCGSRSAQLWICTFQWVQL